MLITSPQEYLKSWMQQQIGYGDFNVPATFFGKQVNGELIAVAGYTNHNPDTSSIYIHLAGATDRNWLMRDFLWFMFAYPFIQLQCSVLFAAVLESNERCLNLAKKLGFIQQKVSSENFAGQQVLILMLHKNSCKYI